MATIPFPTSPDPDVRLAELHDILCNASWLLSDRPSRLALQEEILAPAHALRWAIQQGIRPKKAGGLVGAKQQVWVLYGRAWIDNVFTVTMRFIGPDEKSEGSEFRVYAVSVGRKS